MKLYLMRHGDAESYVHSDKERALTEKGRHQAEEVAKHFLEEGWELPKKIITSPYLRAEETARILGETLAIHDIKVISYKEATHWVDMKRYIGNEPILFVSHEPFLSNLIERLTGEYLKVTKGSVHWIDYDAIGDTGDYKGSVES